MRCTFGAILLAFLLAAVTSCEPVRQDLSVSILPSGEQLGLTEPCGCSRPQIGGISRRAAFVQQLRESGRRVLLVDNGDLVSNPGLQASIKFETFLHAMKSMGYAALNIGERELYFEIDFLSQQSQISDISFVSANIFIHADRPFQPYILEQLKYDDGTSIDVGIVGVLSPALVDEVGLSADGLEIRDPATILREILSEVKKSTDFIILLAHTNLDDALELAESFPEIAVIVSGHDIDPPPEGYTTIGNSVIVNPGIKGKYQVRLDAVLVAETNQLQMSWLVTPLEESLATSKEIEGILLRYQEALRDQDLLRSHPKVGHQRGVYVGAQACAECHEETFQTWKSSKHAGAHKTLVDAKHVYDPECVVCHADGLDYSTGFITLDETPELAAVGCESCHGPGGNHIDDQSVSMRTAGEEGCRVCHTGDQSPHFKLDTYWPKVKH